MNDCKIQCSPRDSNPGEINISIELCEKNQQVNANGMEQRQIVC